MVEIHDPGLFESVATWITVSVIAMSVIIIILAIIFGRKHASSLFLVIFWTVACAVVASVIGFSVAVQETKPVYALQGTVVYVVPEGDHLRVTLEGGASFKTTDASMSYLVGQEFVFKCENFGAESGYFCEVEENSNE